MNGFEGIVAEVSGEQQDTRIPLGQVGEGLGEGPSHAPAPISASACRYSSSFMGQ